MGTKMTSSKSLTNKKWTSSEDYKDNFDRIFGKEINGVKFAPGVDTSGVDFEAEADPELLDCIENGKELYTLPVEEWTKELPEALNKEWVERLQFTCKYWYDSSKEWKQLYYELKHRMNGLEK